MFVCLTACVCVWPHTQGQLCAQIDHESNHVVFTDDGDQHEVSQMAHSTTGASVLCVVGVAGWQEASAAGPSGGADESVRTAADLDRQITQMLAIARQLKKYENDVSTQISTAQHTEPHTYVELTDVLWVWCVQLSLNENYLRRQMGSASEFSAAGGLGLDEDGLRGGGSGGLDYGELIDDV